MLYTDHQTTGSMRETGLGIKLRFLLALSLVALTPAILLVLLLGDPSGQEQQTALGQSLFLQAQAQAQALSSAFSLRQSTVAAVAATPSLASLATLRGEPAPVPLTRGQQLLASAREVLQTQQHADPAALAWLLVDPNGGILASAGDTPAGTPLLHTPFVSHPSMLTAFIQRTADGMPSLPVVNGDTRNAWIAFAAPLQTTSAPHPVVLTVDSLPRLIAGLIAMPATLSNAAALLLDHDGRVVAYTGTLPGVAPFLPAPGAFLHLPLETASPTVIQANPLTGRNDLAVGVPVPVLSGRYVLLAPQDTSLVPSTRALVAGRNTPLLLLLLLVGSILVATWVALPIVRPIRRATRGINATTKEVQRLSVQAQQIARDHRLGNTILSATSKRLSTRRQAILRDSLLIQQTCEALRPRLALLLQAAQRSNRQVAEVLHSVQQGISQIAQVAGEMSKGLANDPSLGQLDTAMLSAHEMSTQFEAAGEHLERESQQLALAARQLR